MVAMSAACDLDWDFKARFAGGDIQEPNADPFETETNPKVLPYLLLCEAVEESAIRAGLDAGTKAKALDRIKTIQDERYHYLPTAPVGEEGSGSLPDLYLDFKKVVAVPTGSLYEGIRRGNINRIGVLPVWHVHSLVQRFYAFLSRIGVPD